MRTLFFMLCLLIAPLMARAQAADYKVERDTAGGLLLVQNGQSVPFDTATIHNNITVKDEELSTVENEIALLERLVLLRRQAAQIKGEKRTLLDILDLSRKCPPLPAAIKP